MTDYMAYFLEKEKEKGEAKPPTKPLNGPRRPNGRADRQARAAARHAEGGQPS